MNRRGFFKALGAAAVAHHPLLRSLAPLGVPLTAAPALSFVNDTDTGLYQTGANRIAIGVGGAYARHLAQRMIDTKETLTANILNRAYES